MRRLMAILAAVGVLGGCAAPSGMQGAAALNGSAGGFLQGLAPGALPQMRRFADAPAPAEASFVVGDRRVPAAGVAVWR